MEPRMVEKIIKGLQSTFFQKFNSHCVKKNHLNKTKITDYKNVKTYPI